MPTFRTIVATATALACVLFSAPPMAGAQGDDAAKARFVEIQNLNGFSGFFNLGQGTVRIVAVLSPSCEECLSAFGEIQRIVEETPTKRLRAFLVYVPGENPDGRILALDRAGDFRDRRVAHIWDPNTAILDIMATVSELGETNPHGCLLFDTNAVIKDATITSPAVQMSIHGRDGLTPFDASALEARANDLLAALAAQNPDASRRPASESP